MTLGTHATIMQTIGDKCGSMTLDNMIVAWTTKLSPLFTKWSWFQS